MLFSRASVASACRGGLIAFAGEDGGDVLVFDVVELLLARDRVGVSIGSE